MHGRCRCSPAFYRRARPRPATLTGPSKGRPYIADRSRLWRRRRRVLAAVDGAGHAGVSPGVAAAAAGEGAVDGGAVDQQSPRERADRRRALEQALETVLDRGLGDQRAEVVAE